MNIPLDKKNIFSFQPDISYGALFRFPDEKKNTNLNIGGIKCLVHIIKLKV